MPSSFIHNDHEIKDPLEIANKFCEFFTNIGPNLAKKLPQSEVSHEAFLRKNVDETIFLRPVSENEILNIAKSFKSGKATGYDNIKIDDIKENIDLLSAPLAHLLNTSISSGIVPNDNKIGRIIPVYKNDNASLFNNYRPISILPALSKFFEKAIAVRITNFIEKHDIIYKHQYGFRPKHSTSLALLHLVNQISSSIDNKETCAGVFLDLSKAFDTVNHNILLNKLNHYGIRGLALDWIKNYLNDRKQYVDYKDISSEYQTVKCGVPQGSILGPLLFLLYINDITYSSDLLKFILFADDTSVFYSSKSISDVFGTLNYELAKVSKWLIANKLSINVKKN